jgi:alpha-L-rhamnosidase
MHGAPSRLRCEYLEDPVGIDDPSPRLSWWPDDARPAEIQTAYEILAASTLDLLALDEGDFWDSGRVESQQSSNIVYRGKRLVSGRRVYWKVRSFDSDGLPSPWSEPALFEAGLLSPSDWRAGWISAPLTGSRATSVPVPILRRHFDLASAPRSARLYVAALGIHQIEVNGHAVSTHELAPGWCDFERQAVYQTYDITQYLDSGSNAIAVLLGDGWFSGRSGLGSRQHYGQRPELCAQLHVELASGARLIIATDENWQWTPSWILASDPIAGESCDWRQKDADWSSAACQVAGYPVLTSERNLPLHAARQRSVRRLRTLTPELLTTSSEQAVYALPALTVGRAAIVCDLPAGALVTVRYGMAVDSAGALTDIAGEDVHVASGGSEQMESHFALHGFRYLEVVGDLLPVRDMTVSVIEFGQPVAALAHFVCDRSDITALFDSLTGYLARTLQSVPWTGLSTAKRHPRTAENAGRIKALLTAHAAEAELSDWLFTVRESQLESGGFPAVVPAPPDLEYFVFDADEAGSEIVSEDSGDVLVEGAWQQFRLIGDRRALEQAYPRIVRFLKRIAERYPRHICGEPPDDLAATLRFYRSARTASRMAGVLGKLSDLEDFEMLAGGIRQAFRRRFITADGRLVSDSLNAYLGALSQGMFDPQERAGALLEFYRHLDRPSEGDAAAGLAPDLLRTLTLLGRVERVYELIEGVAERQPAADAELSKLSGSGVLEWLVGCLAGLDQGRDLSETANAYRHMRIQPRPLLDGPGSAGLISAGPPVRSLEAALDTVNGRYEVNWQVSDDAFEVTVVVPCNCRADLIMPDDTVHEVVSGRHTFTMAFQNAGDGIPVLREVSRG